MPTNIITQDFMKRYSIDNPFSSRYFLPKLSDFIEQLSISSLLETIFSISYQR